MACFMPKESCLYSASVVENETSACVWHDQSMALLWNLITAPEVHLPSTIMSSLLHQSASQYTSRVLVFSCLMYVSYRPRTGHRGDGVRDKGFAASLLCNWAP